MREKIGEKSVTSPWQLNEIHINVSGTKSLNQQINLNFLNCSLLFLLFLHMHFTPVRKAFALPTLLQKMLKLQQTSRLVQQLPYSL